MAIYTKKFPHEAPDLMKYGEIVRDLAQKGFNYAWAFMIPTLGLLGHKSQSHGITFIQNFGFEPLPCNQITFSHFDPPDQIEQADLSKTISRNSWMVTAGHSTEKGFAMSATAPVPISVATVKGQTTPDLNAFIPLKSMPQRPLNQNLNPNMVNKPYLDQSLATNINGSVGVRQSDCRIFNRVTVNKENIPSHKCNRVVFYTFLLSVVCFAESIFSFR